MAHYPHLHLQEEEEMPQCSRWEWRSSLLFLLPLGQLPPTTPPPPLLLLIQCIWDVNFAFTVERKGGPRGGGKKKHLTRFYSLVQNKKKRNHKRTGSSVGGYQRRRSGARHSTTHTNAIAVHYSTSSRPSHPSALRLFCLCFLADASRHQFSVEKEEIATRMGRG